MKRLAKACAALAGTVLLAGAAFADQITVEANKSKAVRLKGAASAIVVGNPTFADVAVHNEHLIFITGKTFGTTNLLIFDKDGRQIFSGDIVVTTSSSNLMVVNRAGISNTYDCAGNCRAVAAVGDSIQSPQEHFSDVIEQNEALKELAN